MIQYSSVVNWLYDEEAGMGKYDPLRDYLMRCGSDDVLLSFADVEAILGCPLPPSASKYDAWWANIGDDPFTQHSHARSWHAAQAGTGCGAAD